MIGTALRFAGGLTALSAPCDQGQFAAAHPEAVQLRVLKHRADTGGKFSNELWAKYL